MENFSIAMQSHILNWTFTFYLRIVWAAHKSLHPKAMSLPLPSVIDPMQISNYVHTCW